MKSRRARGIVWILAVVACLIGGGASAYLTYEYVQIAPLGPQLDTPGEEATEEQGDAPDAEIAGDDEHGLMDRICTAYASWSCEQVSQSPYGRFPFHSTPPQPGLPTAELGLIYFIFALTWLVMVGIPSPSRWWLHGFFASVTAFGLGFSILLEYLMWFRLDFRCPFCIIAHVAVAVVFVAVLLLWPESSESNPGRANKDKNKDKDAKHARANNPGRSSGKPHPSARVVLATLVVVLLAVGFQRQTWRTITLHRFGKTMAGDQCQRELQGQRWLVNHWQERFRQYDDRWQNVVMNYSLEPVIPLETDGEPFYGDPDARHTIVLFSGPQCPACARLDEMLHNRVLALAEPYGGAKIIYKHWPMNTDCNDKVSRTTHPQACLAARAMEGANIVGGREKFWEMLDTIVKNRARLRTADKQWFITLARRIGLDPLAFAQAMDSEQATARIQAHIEESQNLGVGVLTGRDLERMKVDSTPTVFVNNRPLRTTRHLRAWQEIFRRFPPQDASVASGTE